MSGKRHRVSKAQFHKVTGLMLWCGLGLIGQAQQAPVPAYVEGETALADVVLPVALEVVDPAKTEQLRREAAAKVPMIYRFELEAGRAAERVFREAFSRHRERFMQAMELAAKRPKLDAATVQHPSFSRFIGWFREQYPGFGLTTNLARAWALQEPDEPFQERWLGYLREAMNHCILSEGSVLSEPTEPALVRVVSAPTPGAVLTRRLVERDGVMLRPADLLSVAEARARLTTNLAEEPEVLGPFLAGCIRENCFAEEELTRSLRSQATADVLAVDRYEAGQILVRQGERIDGRTKLALDLLRTQLDHPGELQLAPTGRAQGLWAGLKGVCQRMVSHPLTLENTALRGLGLLAVVSLLATGILGWLVRARRISRALPPGPTASEPAYTVVLNPQQNETVFLPANIPPGRAEVKQTASAAAEAAPGCAESAVSLSDRFWQERALEAERRAAEILALVRAGLAPQLARQMMHKLVQELIFQRADWLRTQRIAEQDLAMIEQRFAQAHDELIDRLRAFEKRTDELERALALKAAENTELIKAHIAHAQKQLATKEAAAVTIWN